MRDRKITDVVCPIDTAVVAEINGFLCGIIELGMGYDNVMVGVCRAVCPVSLNCESGAAIPALLYIYPCYKHERGVGRIDPESIAIPSLAAKKAYGVGCTGIGINPVKVLARICALIDFA
jgi:hypothetical protein